MADNSKALTMSREQMASYVHDVAEIEENEFALIKLKDKISQDMENTLSARKKHIETCDYALERQKENFETTKFAFVKKYGEKEFDSINFNNAIKEPAVVSRAEEYAQPENPSPKFWKKIFTCVIISFVFGLLSIPITEGTDVNFLYAFCVGFLTMSFLTGFVWIFATLDYRKEYKAYRAAMIEWYENLRASRKYQEYLKSYAKYNLYVQKSNVKKAEADKAEAELDLKKAENQKLICDAKCDDIEKKIATIHKNKISLYSLNIIPPDYRTIDCAMQIDQMFRNGLADTMKEAVLLYEERVFKGEIVTGINNIYSMLGQLSRGMARIEERLIEIRREVSSMGDEIFCLSENVKESSALQEKIFDESRATRYATESVSRSNDRLEWYARYGKYL